MKRGYVAIAALVFGVVFFGGVVSAQEIPVTTQNRQSIQDAARNKADEAKKQAQSMVEQKRSSVEQRTQEARKTACENRKNVVSARLTSIASFGQRHKGTFDSVLSRVEQFVASRQLEVPGADQLLATIASQKTVVESEVAALEALKGTINCDVPDSVATNLEAFKSQTAVLRTELQTYREAIRAYVQAVRQTASEQVQEVREGGQQ